MSISKEKEEQLKKRLKSLEIHESDLEELFILGSGSGGQKINKTNSCVYLKHLPSGIEIKCQRDRSREMNRYYARKLLAEKLEEQVLGAESKKQQAIEKIRRQKQRRSRRAKTKLIEDKRHRSNIKKMHDPKKFLD